MKRAIALALIKTVALVAAVFLSTYSSATTFTYYRYYDTTWDSTSTHKFDLAPDFFCQTRFNKKKASYPGPTYTYVGCFPDSTGAKLKYYSDSQLMTQQSATLLTHDCPAGQVLSLNILSGPSCVNSTCNAGEEFQAMVPCGSWSCSGTMSADANGVYQCVGAETQTSLVTPTGSYVQDYCVGNYSHLLTGTPKIKISQAASGAGTLYCAAAFTETGEISATNTNPEQSLGNLPQDGPCPSGTAHGTVNGVEMCVPGSGDTGGDGTDPDGTDPDGTDPDGTDPDGTDPDGTDPDGTDPDGTDPDGTGGTGGTGSGTGTATATECAEEPACTGDELQCAQLKQTWLSMCSWKKDDSGSSTKATELMDELGEEVEGTQNRVNAELNDILSEFSAAISITGTVSCPPDFTFTFKGASIKLPYSDMCWFFQLFRVFVLLGAYMGAAAIVFASVK